MSTQTTGRAALVANNLPTSKTVSGATNATPIVVTTTTAHGLQVNEIFTITGVTGNTAANGVFIAGAVTSTTVTLTAYPGGTNVAASGAYVSGGTLQSLGFGVTVPVPNDLTDLQTAGSVNVPHEAELDRLAWLAYAATRSSSAIGTAIEKFANQLWFVGSSVASGSLAQSSVAAAATAYMPLPVPHGSVLLSLKVRFIPNAHVSLPAVMPSIVITKVDGVTGTLTTTWTQADTSGSTVAYNAAHYVTLTIPETERIDHQGYVYLLQVTGESGANSDTLLIGQPVPAIV